MIGIFGTSAPDGTPAQPTEPLQEPARCSNCDDPVRMPGMCLTCRTERTERDREPAPNSMGKGGRKRP